MLKVKRERTADCVVAGMRLLPGWPAVSSLLLGLYQHAPADRYDENRSSPAGLLRHVGVVQAFPAPTRRQLLAELRRLVVPLAEHPWAGGFGLEGGPTGRLKGAGSRWTPDLSLDWVPLRPELVCEVAYDAVDGVRFRHPARFRRWRPDREPESCHLDQLA